MNQVRKENHAKELAMRYMQFSIDQAPIALYWIKSDGGFAYVNNKACESLKYKRDELLKLKLWEIDPIFPKERWDKEWAGYQKDELGTQNIQTIHKRKDGTQFPVEIISKHIWFEGTEFHIAFANDITERSRVEKTLIESEKKLRDANISKDKLFSIISHDLRNLFNCILGYSDILLEKCSSIQDNEILTIVADLKKSTLNTFLLLEDLLKWANTQLGRIEIKGEVINLAILVQESISPFMAAAIEKEINVITNINNRISCFCDFATTRIVIENIFNNAIKFTKSGGTIKITNEIIGNYNILSIVDSGIGMTEETVENLFNFSAVKTTPGTNNELGTGLGLILCKEFIDKNGGKIEVKSKFGEGSEFKVFIPLH